MGRLKSSNHQSFAESLRFDTPIREISEQDKATRRLWAAVFRLAIADVGYELKRGKPDTAVLWLHDRRHTPGSWSWLCEMFDLDADRARARAMELGGRTARRVGAYKSALSPDLKAQ